MTSAECSDRRQILEVRRTQSLFENPDQLSTQFFNQTEGKTTMTKEQFMRATGCKSEVFGSKLFETIDCDKSGDITLEELMTALSKLRSPDSMERIRFVFSIFDLDGDGRIARQDLETVIRASVEESDNQMNEEETNQFVCALLHVFDSEGTDDITLMEFADVIKNYPDLLKGLTFGTFGTLGSTSERDNQSLKKKRFRRIRKMASWVINNPQRLFTYSSVTLLLICCFLWRFLKYAGNCDGVDMYYHDSLTGYCRSDILEIAKTKQGMMINNEDIGYMVISKDMAYMDPIECRDARKRKLFSWTLPIAKGCGQAMKAIFTLILIPVSRNLMTTLRETFLKHVFHFDGAIEFHRFLGKVGFWLAWVHTLCHIVDIKNWIDPARFKYWSWAFPEEKDTDEVKGCQRNEHGDPVYDDQGHMILNAEMTDGMPNLLLNAKHQPTFGDIICSAVAITGIILIVIYTIAAVFAFDYPKKLRTFKITGQDKRGDISKFRKIVLFVGRSLNDFNNFWYSHHLFSIFYIALLFHPIPALPDEHNEWNVSDSWLWVGIPAMIYLIERGADILPGNVVGLKVLRPRGFNYTPGQYVFIKCPQISRYEWHPFTLTSAPGDSYLGVHVRKAGDWTSALHEKVSNYHMNKDLSLKEASQQSAARSNLVVKPVVGEELEVFDTFPFTICVDGPFGAPAQNHSDYRVIVLIGAGIGVTPFASVLTNLLDSLKQCACPRCGYSNPERMGTRIKKVYFYWTVRSRCEASWFKHLLEEISLRDEDGFLDMNIHITGIKGAKDLRTMMLSLAQYECADEFGSDVHSRTVTHFGRINWTSVFEKVKLIVNVRRTQSLFENPSQLRTQFFNHTEGKDAMTKEQFIRATGCKSEVFGSKLFETLDCDKSGDITLEELMLGLQKLQSADIMERIRFVFSIFDLDGDGKITIKDLKMVCRASVEESNNEMTDEEASQLVSALLQLFDTDNSDDITLDEFADVLRHYPDLLNGLTFGTFGTLDSAGEKANHSRKKSFRRIRKTTSWVINNPQRIFTYGLVVLVLIGCFLWRFLKYAGNCDGVDMYNYDSLTGYCRSDIMEIANTRQGIVIDNKDIGYMVISKDMAYMDPIECRDARKRKLFSWTLPIAKGCGQAMKAIFTLILIPVSRNLMTTLRETFLKHVFHFDGAIEFHRFLGKVGFVLAWIHTLCHIIDIKNWIDPARFKYWSWAFPEEKDTDEVKGCQRNEHGDPVYDDQGHMILNAEITDGMPDLFLNAKHQPTFGDIICSAVAITGIILIVIYTIAATFAFDYPKKLRTFKMTGQDKRGDISKFRKIVLFVGRSLNDFNNFWYSHHLFVVFYIALLFHPIPALPDERSEWNVSDSWLWVGIPVLIYLIERVLRVKRSTNCTPVVGADILPGNVVGLKVLRPRGFNYTPGQYVFIKCPQISRFEWHPFTLTSAPGDSYLGVHVRKAGDWTSALHAMVKKFPKKTLSSKGIACRNVPESSIVVRSVVSEEVQVSDIFPFTICVDGPFGAPAQNHSDYRVIVLIGAGIGVTPFASVLKNLLDSLKQCACPRCGYSNPERMGTRIKKVYFYWTVRSRCEASWFKHLLEAISLRDEAGFLDISIHITGIKGAKDLRTMMLSLAQYECADESSSDVLSRTVTHFGRINWTSVFEKVKSDFPAEPNVGVFYCGPNTIAKPMLEFRRTQSLFESLGQLNVQFSKETEGKNSMTKEQFMHATGCKSEVFGSKLFETLDCDKSGDITLEELMLGLQKLQSADIMERIRFVFSIFDLDGDGKITIKDLEMVCRASVEESNNEMTDEEASQLVSALLQLFDTDNSDDITLDEFADVLRHYPDLLSGLTFGTFGTLDSAGEKEHQSQKKSFRRVRKMASWVINHPQCIYTYGLVILILIGCFLWRFLKYAGDCNGVDLEYRDPLTGYSRSDILEMAENDPNLQLDVKDVRYMVFSKEMADADAVKCRDARKRRLFTWTLPIAKGCGQAMKATFTLILFPVSRNLMTTLRETFLKHIFLFDGAIEFHRFLGKVGLLLAWIHALSHVVDIKNWVDSDRFSYWSWAFPDERDIDDLEGCSRDANGNPIYNDEGRIVSNGEMIDGLPRLLFNVDEQPTIRDIMFSAAAITGIILLLVYTTAALFALDYPKKLKIFKMTEMDKRGNISRFRMFILSIGRSLNDFNNFWYTHNLFAIFYIALLLHPLPALPDERNEWDVSDTWLWVGIPVIIYFTERALRVKRSTDSTPVVGADILPGDVVGLRVLRPRGFNYTPGQYVFIKCPQISRYEWHPFTLTSAPGESFLGVHVRKAGDWTSALHAMVHDYHMNKEMSVVESGPDLGRTSITVRSVVEEEVEVFDTFPFTISVDGPFGAPAQNHADYRVIVLIGAGIGVTPFASVLTDLLDSMKRCACSRCGYSNPEKMGTRIKKVYFYWTVRSRSEASWFKHLLEAISHRDEVGFLDMNIHITGIKGVKDLRTMMLSLAQYQSAEDSHSDFNFRTVTRFGRINWARIFEKVKSDFPTESNVVESSETQLAAVRNESSVLGAIALITGSTVGAGMLALPQATAAGGFLPSFTVLFLSSLILTSEALLLAEVNFSVKENRRLKKQDSDESVISIREMAEGTMGPAGGSLVSGLYLFVSYTLLVAYISKGGELMELMSAQNLPSSPSSVILTLGIGTLLWRGSEKTVDFTNRALTSILLILFGVLLLTGSQSADFSSLLTHQNWSEEWSALPVVFLALVYHDLVPLICKYLGWNKGKIRTALICGSFIPFALFVAWDAVVLALVPGTVNVVEAGGVLDPITVLIETQGEFTGHAIGLFSLLAISTSFIGTALSLTEHLKAELQHWFTTRNVKSEMELDCNTLAVCFALGPPSFAAFSNPGLFLMATRIAGGYGMTLLYGVLPPIMAWYMRHPKGCPSCARRPPNFVPGGRPVLASLTSFAASIEIGKLCSDLGEIFSTSGVAGVVAVATRPITEVVNGPVADLAAIDSSINAIGNIQG
eukprot:g4491.t1